MVKVFCLYFNQGVAIMFGDLSLIKRCIAYSFLGVSFMFPSFTTVAADEFLNGFSFETQDVRMSQNIAHALIEKQAGVVIDVRTPEEYAYEHIAGAYNLELEGLADNPQLKILQEANVPVLLYCRTGRRSGLAAELLRSRGIEQSFNFGGVLTWEYGFTSDVPTIPLEEAVKQVKPL